MPITCPVCEDTIPLEPLRLSISGLTLEEKLSIRGTINAQLRMHIGRNGARPRDKTQPRCPCKRMTLKRAKTRKHVVDGVCNPAVT